MGTLARRFCLALILAIAAVPLDSAAQPALAPGDAVGGPSQVDTILFYGQSNAGAGGTGPALLLAPAFPGRLLTFATASQVYSTRLVGSDALRGTAPLHDHPRYAPFPATAMGHALAAGWPERRFFLHTTWVGGEPLSTFLPGTLAWQNLHNSAVAQKVAMAGEGRQSRIGAVVLIQGESGPLGQVPYAQMLRGLAQSLPVSLQAAASQAHKPVLLIPQVIMPDAAGIIPSGVELAQWSVAQAMPDEVALVGPMYPFPLADAIHQNAEGRMMLGETLALVHEQVVVRQERFVPLHPAAITRDGRVLSATFNRPKGSGNLRWDEDWIAPSPNYGFTYKDAKTDIAISSIEIVGPDTVRITLDAEPSASGGALLYAQGQPRAAGWTSGRGQLVAPSGQESHFARAGYRVPRQIDHYCIRFEMAVP